MTVKVTKNYGPARTGTLELEDKKISFPNILYLETKRYTPPKFSEIILTDLNKKTNDKPTLKLKDDKQIQNELEIPQTLIFPKDLPKEIHIENLNKPVKKQKISVIPAKKETIRNTTKNKNIDLYIINNSYQLYNQPKKFVDFIISLRQNIGYEKTIYTPAIATPSNLAILTYLGIDFLDATQAIINARDNIMLFNDKETKIQNLKEIPCICPACIKTKKMNFNKILEHNYYSFLSELRNVRNHIINDTIRNLVEIRAKNHPHYTTILRYIDQKYYDYIEKETPMHNDNTLYSTAYESYNRAEIKRFQERVLTRYRKPESAKILLLMPCASRKPYSFSKSHQLFRKQIQKSKNANIFHELIITSPIGLVPKELELIYPASNYDIPVTGIWDENEKQMIRAQLKKYLQKNKYDKIINHLPENITEFIEDLLKKPVNTCLNHPTSDESLKKLAEETQKIAKPYKKINHKKVIKEKVKNIACYQLGYANAENLIHDTQIKGKYPYLRIMQGKTQLGMITQPRGLISLTLNGAEKIKDTGEYYVEISNDFTLVGSVFTPGIINADSQIRPQDDVIILQKNKLAGVGIAQINGEKMTLTKYGEAVKTRHIKK